MGEVIKNISEFKICDCDVRVELNESQNNLKEFDIHIETDFFRFSIHDNDFMKFSCAVMEARRKLLNVKEIERE